MEVETLERATPKFSWSTITCGEGCWSALEEDCKCSCGGANHGIWRTSKNANVQRTRKISGTLYKLVGVGTRRELHERQVELLSKYGVSRCYDYYGKGEFYHDNYVDNLHCRGDADYGFPVKLKNATDSEISRWKELQPYKNYTVDHDYLNVVATLWELFVIPAPCQHTCQNAIKIVTK